MRAFSLCLRDALVLALLLQLRTAGLGAPFAEQVPFTQPDGTQIVLWGEGDEFYAVFETLQGYSVLFNPQTKAYEYAALSADRSQLIPTGIVVGRGNPAAKALKQHLRVNREAIRKQVAERFARWDEGMEMTRHWEELKGARRLAEQTYSAQVVPNSPPSATTTGQRLGLTLLIDFSDAAATIPQADMDNLCNGDNYSGYGNNGSVKNYFLDVSNNQLTYSNVVTVYIRAPQPKTYYNDTAVDDGVEGRKLITEVLNVMKGLPNYTNGILPTFANLSVDGSSRVRACNVFFAGANSGVWAKGLWPHSSSLSSSVDLGNGKKVSRYQITNIGTSPGIGTFCHENGHMLCGFPDLYDYDYDSKGGAGNFCLMGSGNAAHTPVQVCAYLKRAAGWASTTEWTSDMALTATVGSSGTNFNRFYRYAKPGVNTEYFLIENRQKSGRDSSLPGSGIAIWHVDELGNRDNQSTNFNTTHANYELSLVQADNLWHLQNNSNSGDSKDLYFLGSTAAGYSNLFSDSTSPSARWWSGEASGLSLHHFSASGATMTVGVGGQVPFIVAPISQSVLAGATVSFAAEVSGTSPMSLQWRRFGTNLADGGKLSGAATTNLTLSNARPPDMGPYALTASNDYGSATSSVALLSVEGPCLTLRLAEGPNAERTNAILTFPSIAGVDSVVECRDGLARNNDWLPILTNAGTGDLITNELGIAADPSVRFYRVVVP